VKHTLADISKAQSKLGYEPTVDFAEGMRRTCDYFVRRFGAAAA
jgi:nucleoside-diphosphate-sugar epimerase